MCGISGIVGPGDHRSEMEAMLEAIRHRGPDGGGHWQEGDCCLGMRRLSIVDLPGGDQPMLTEDGRVGIVFNGEIYNYLELRDELAPRGHQFRTSSDTEVLLRSYLEFGPDCVDHLRGMFGFAIWDAPERRLLLARDRVGKKPLYYGWRGQDLVFASELKALIGLADLRLEVDEAALAQYLARGYVPGPRTIFSGFKKLQPGCALTWRPGDAEPRLWRYWKPPFDDQPQAAPSLPGALDLLRTHLTEAVRLRLRSDVPIGTLLSGGLDSSVIAALMVRLSSQQIRTFSVGFAGGGEVDESRHAREVARLLGTEHHELRVEGKVTDILPEVVWHMDEPFADAAAVPTFQIAAVARQHVKVVLTGEGADELFGGYGYIATLHHTAAVEQLPLAVRAGMSSLARPLELLPPRALTIRLARLLRSFPKELPDRYRRTVSVFGPEMRHRLLASGSAGLNGAGEIELPERAPSSEPLRWLLAALFESWLPDDLLMKVDKMTMAFGLEARAPYLDHLLVEEMVRLPARYKIRGRTRKYLLRQLAQELLPSSIVNRPKHGFDVPTDAWLRGELRDLMLDTLTEPALEKSGLLEPREVRRLVSDHLTERGQHGQQLWSILCLQLWHQQFMQGGPSAAAPCTAQLWRAPS